MAITRSKIRKVADILKVISHPTRLEIITLLQSGKNLNVSLICSKLDVEQSLVSHHLAAMRNSGVLKATRDGINISYSIQEPKVLEVIAKVLDSKLMKN